MRIIYLSSTVPDVIWMRRYCASVFPQGERKARQHLEAVERLITENPRAGKSIGDARERPISHTPFSLIYRINGDTIEVMRVWDQRRNSDDF